MIDVFNVIRIKRFFLCVTSQNAFNLAELIVSLISKTNTGQVQTTNNQNIQLSKPNHLKCT